MDGGWDGEAMVQRWVASVVRWVDRAAAMGGRLAWKEAMSLARMGRSVDGIWPDSWAVTISMRAWRS